MCTCACKFDKQHLPPLGAAAEQIALSLNSLQVYGAERKMIGFCEAVFWIMIAFSSFYQKSLITLGYSGTMQACECDTSRALKQRQKIAMIIVSLSTVDFE